MRAAEGVREARNGNGDLFACPLRDQGPYRQSSTCEMISLTCEKNHKADSVEREPMEQLERTPPACTEAGLPPALPIVTDDDIARIARGLAHPARVRILDQFTVCTPHLVQQIVDDSNLAQSTISEHLRVLREADILFARKDGPRVWYCMRRSVLRSFAQAILDLADDSALYDQQPVVLIEGR
jgi:ArsR family transcriptional regulator